MQIVKNKYLNALCLLMLFSAAVHMVMLLFIAIKTGKFYFLNYFNIMSSGYLAPSLQDSFLWNAFSVIFMLILYILILKINKR